jgi:hypothetical protein
MAKINSNMKICCDNVLNRQIQKNGNINLTKLYSELSQKYTNYHIFRIITEFFHKFSVKQQMSTNNTFASLFQQKR